MRTIRSIIVDDEKPAREALSSLLELYCPEVQLIAQHSNLKDAICAIQQFQPDLVFLDIEIGLDNGFDLFHQISPTDFKVIFTTAHSEFAIKAFRVNALDYLLKPIDPKELQTSIRKIHAQAHQNTPTKIQELLQQVQHLNSTPQITISTQEGYFVIPFQKIIRIEGSGNYSTFFTSEEDSIIASKSLLHYEKLLPTSEFYRCHQSHLIRLAHIKQIQTKDGLCVQLNNGHRVPLAQKRKEKLLQLLRGGSINF